MKTLKLLTLALVSLIFVACEKENEEFAGIDGISIENYPKVDGSTSTYPLNRLIASKLLGFNYAWKQEVFLDNTWYLWTDLPQEFLIENIKSSQTHNAFINLIDKKADIILSARKMSPDEQAYAEQEGVSLIETPIALDALVFLKNPKNTVKSLTSNQIQDIYLGEITRWREVGGSNNTINPYIRNANSGSQELMESLVMQGTDMPDWEVEWMDDFMIPSMMGVFMRLRSDEYGLCYTVYYYKEMIIREQHVKTIAVNGISPNKNTIKNKTYPYVAEVYAIIRDDLDETSMAYKMHEWLLTETGKRVINESGYVSN